MWKGLFLQGGRSPGSSVGESDSSIFISVPPLNGGSTLKGKNLHPWEQILSFKSRPLVEGSFPAEKKESRGSSVGGSDSSIFISVPPLNGEVNS